MSIYKSIAVCLLAVVAVVSIAVGVEVLKEAHFTPGADISQAEQSAGGTANSIFGLPIQVR